MKGRLQAILVTAGIVLMMVVGTGGAIAADWSFSPVFDLVSGYDDNVLFTRDDKLGDFIVRPSTTVKLVGKTERSVFDLDSDWYGEIYLDHSDLNVFMNRTRASLEHHWSERFSSSCGLSFSKDETLESELEEAGAVAARHTRYRYSANVGADYLLTERTGLQTSASFSYTDYPDGLYPNRTSYLVSVTPYRILSPFDQARLGVYFAYDDYSDSSLLETLGAMLSWRRQLSPTVYFQIGAGYRFTRTSIEQGGYIPIFDPDTGMIIIKFVREKKTSFDQGFIFDLALHKKWTERFATEISAGRRQYSSVTAQSTTRNFVRGTLRYRLFEKTDCSLTLGYDDSQNDHSLGSSDTLYLHVWPSLTHRLSRNLSLRFSGSYEHRLERKNDTGTDRYRAWLGLHYQWPRLWANH